MLQLVVVFYRTPGFSDIVKRQVPPPQEGEVEIDCMISALGILRTVVGCVDPFV